MKRRTPSKTTLGVLATAAAMSFASPSFATIVAWLPDVVKIAPPPDVTLGQLEDDLDIQGFDERQCFQVPAAGLQTDQGMIPPNTWVSSHKFHGDPVTSLLLDGRARFDHDILGVMSSAVLLDNSDATCGAPGTTYPTGIEVNRGLESTQADGYVLLDSRTIRIRMEVPLDSYSDQVRVITRCCPDPQVCD